MLDLSLIPKILRSAKELISKPERWTKKLCARTKFQQDIDPTSDLAVCWCAIGAVIHETKSVPRVNRSRIEEAALTWLRKASKKFGGDGGMTSPPWVNDRNTHDVVMSMFDEAIRLAEE